MEILQKIDTEEQIQEFFDEIKDFISKQPTKTYVALEIVRTFDFGLISKKYLLEVMIRFCKIELNRDPKLNEHEIIKSFLDKAENLYTKLTGE